MLEKDIQNAICDYLALKGYFFWRNNTVGLYDAKSGGYRSMPKYAKAGVPDIILVKDGTFIGLEVKTPKTQQSDAQVAFESGVTKAGGRYHVARSVDDVLALGL